MQPDTGLRWYLPALPPELCCNHCRSERATRLVEGFTAWTCEAPECLNAELARCHESQRIAMQRQRDIFNAAEGST